MPFLAGVFQSFPTFSEMREPPHDSLTGSARLFCATTEVTLGTSTLYFILLFKKMLHIPFVGRSGVYKIL